MKIALSGRRDRELDHGRVATSETKQTEPVGATAMSDTRALSMIQLQHQRQARNSIQATQLRAKADLMAGVGVGANSHQIASGPSLSFKKPVNVGEKLNGGIAHLPDESSSATQLKPVTGYVTWAVTHAVKEVDGTIFGNGNYIEGEIGKQGELKLGDMLEVDDDDIFVSRRQGYQDDEEVRLKNEDEEPMVEWIRVLRIRQDDVTDLNVFVRSETIDIDDNADKGNDAHSRVRPPINLERKPQKHLSLVPEVDLNEKDILSKWGKLNNKNFYANTRASLKIARNHQHPNHAAEKLKLDQLIKGYGESRAVKEMIDGYVRVKARKAKNASSGTGLDELFKTSETMKYLEWSYRPPQGKRATALFDGKVFDWMDAQQQIRLSTEFIVWASEITGEISGHTGTFQREYQQKWMTKMQSWMHEFRDAAISTRSNPVNAIIEAIGTHLRITEDAIGFDADLYKGDEASKALMSSGHSVKNSNELILREISEHRDALKRYVNAFREKSTVDASASPKAARLGGTIYHKNSPMKGAEADTMIIANSDVPENPVPNLADQTRLSYPEINKPIPKMPINPSVELALKAIEKSFGAGKVAQIKRVSKAKIKGARGANGDDEIDEKTIIQIYVEKIRSNLPDGEARARVLKIFENV